MKPEAQTWFVNNQASLKEKYATALQKRNEKGASVLPASYGVTK